MKICRRFFTFLAFFGLGALPVETSAQLTKVTTSYVSDSAGVLPLWLAKEAGIFARNGLDVQGRACARRRGRDGAHVRRTAVRAGVGAGGG